MNVCKNKKNITELYKYLIKEKECKKRKKLMNEKKLIPIVSQLIDNSDRLTSHRINNLSLIIKNVIKNTSHTGGSCNPHNNENTFCYTQNGLYRKNFIKKQTILLQMMGGGGAGGVSYIHGDIIIYAGGGGAGQYYSQYIEVNKDDYWIINIGKGGVSGNGDNTTLGTYDKHNKLILSILVSGGKEGIIITNHHISKNTHLGNMRFKSLISGGCCHDNKGNGDDGCIALPSITGKTGNGGSIQGQTGIGGLGGIVGRPNGGDGFFGSGGGGAMPNATQGSGGDGYLIGLNIC